jgi:hypothetical protein
MPLSAPAASITTHIIFFLRISAPLWQTGCAMLIELWERLRGYDKWIETEAKIESSKVEETPVTDRYGHVSGYTYDSCDMLVWADQQGESQRDFFTVPDDSPLYQFVDGETITIRYNPTSPDQYYLRELLRTRIRTGVKSVVVALLVIGFLVVTVWLRMWQAPR